MTWHLKATVIPVVSGELEIMGRNTGTDTKKILAYSSLFVIQKTIV